METQLQLLKSNHYCFVYDKTTPRKGFAFQLVFVEWDADKQTNKPRSRKTLALSEFAREWEGMKAQGWKVIAS